MALAGPEPVGCAPRSQGPACATQHAMKRSMLEAALVQRSAEKGLKVLAQRWQSESSSKGPRLQQLQEAGLCHEVSSRVAHCTCHCRLAPEPSSCGQAKWWVDGSFAAHEGVRSHAGAMMSLSKGAAHATSTTPWQKKLSAKSSVEAELVAVGGAAPQAGDLGSKLY